MEENVTTETGVVLSTKQALAHTLAVTVLSSIAALAAGKLMEKVYWSGATKLHNQRHSTPEIAQIEQ